MSDYAMICLDYGISRNIKAVTGILKAFKERGLELNYFDHHPYGYGCYDAVHVYFFGMDSKEQLMNANEIAKEEGFTPLLIMDGFDERCKSDFDPNKIILEQPITKKYKKEILKEIAYWEGYRDMKNKQFERKQKEEQEFYRRCDKPSFIKKYCAKYQ